MPGRSRRAQRAAGVTTDPTLYLTPPKGSFTNGSTVTVQIRENSYGIAVNTVQANLSYPSALLQFGSISTTGSPFTTTIQSTGGSGSIQLGVGILSGSVSGDQLVGTVTFTVIATGSARLDFTDGSGVADASTSSDVLKRLFGASYALS